ncbi:MAG: sulfite exporter TauE/SafE family protein [Leptospiraceae bacterium]|nr:sulfite exporter TauE/SafE family protein [Leptospiraceae bacterium]
MSSYLLTLSFAALLQGFFGSLHCVGMCGPFAILVNRINPRLISANLMYNSARLVSYAVFGAIFGMLGRTMDLTVLASMSAILGSVFLLILGFSWIFPQLGLPVNGGWISERWLQRFSKLIQRLENSKAMPAAIGIASGLLPCGLLYPAYSLALLSGSPAGGALIMTVFSLGTWPALLVTGWFSGFLYSRLQQRKWKTFLGVVLIVTALGILAHRFEHASHEHAIGENCETQK